MVHEVWVGFDYGPIVAAEHLCNVLSSWQKGHKIIYIAWTVLREVCPTELCTHWLTLDHKMGPISPGVRLAPHTPDTPIPHFLLQHMHTSALMANMCIQKVQSHCDGRVFKDTSFCGRAHYKWTQQPCVQTVFINKMDIARTNQSNKK